MIKKQNKGFTLMEVLIYTAILGATGTILSGVLLNTTKIKSRQSAVIEVNEQLNFVLQNIQRSISDSSFIDIDNGVSTSTLVLRFKDEAKNPTQFYISENKIYKKEAANAALPLTDDSVVATAVNFLKVSGYSGHDSLQIDLTLSYNTNNIGSAFSRTLSSAIARVSAATFDSDLIPGSAIHDLGTTDNKWQDLYVSGITSFGGVDYTWPASDGTSGQSLSTNGLGVLSWATPSSAWTTLGSNIYNSNAGNVGVGTTTPSDMLTIGGSSGTIGLSIRGDNAACTVYPCIRTGGGGSLQIDSSTASGAFGKLYLNNTKNSDVLIAVGGGNVGIGTTNPTGKTHTIIGDTSALSALWTTSDYNDSTHVGSSFRLRFGAATANTYTDLQAITTGGTVVGNLALNPSGGNVGIGTTAPGTTLEVNGISTFSIGGVANAGLKIDGASIKTAYAANDVMSYILSTGGAGGSYPFNTAGNLVFVPRSTTGASRDIVFATGNTTPTVNMVIQNGGNIGIGTTGPGAKLDINGDFKINGTGAPTAGGALCLNASNKLSKCTSVVDASGNCTCP